ncbi:galactitol-1-phosphate 5-dehydrogenase [Bythopirellula goksoeyrii]|uniref:Sorbitol dehydrogenase n=1 Tax=Bythopirellula goksoeyrii TaxID=1400387 RepID=A0A5B9Q5Y2_9BACT|nr:galactitol-1-phosphate 5-dehydrogenase [Bythopirellula goksoeyrii]QEG33099.1 Sorbitol dehydrogenase [Bythopirellula goksoeyrii]
MKALLLTEPGKLEISELADPVAGADEVLVRVAACGICGSDIHGFDGSTGRRIPPLVMGHEAAGTISAVGSAVSDFREGDRVTFDSTISCGKCAYCQQGKINLCDDRQVLGVSCGEYRRHGAFAEMVAVPARILYRLPDDLVMEHAALLEAVSVAVHAVRRSELVRGETAVVVGTGMIGLLVVQVLKHYGCSQVYAVDQDQRRLELALALGADETILASEDDLVDRLIEAHDGQGLDHAFEVVGITATVQTAVQAVRRGGTVTLVGNLAPEVALPLQAVVTRELTLRGTCASSGEYPECLELIVSGAVQVAPLISATANLDEGPEWFERLFNGEPGLMKVVLKP